MKSHNFRKLKIYQRAVDYTIEIYRVSKGFPKAEIFGLTSQIRRAAISISLNIAEGSGNRSVKEFRRFLEISLRSTYEVCTCIEIALRLNYCSVSDGAALAAEADEIAAMISGFSRSLSSYI